MAISPLPLRVRAELFGQLNALTQAGVPLLRAFALLKGLPQARDRIDTTERLLLRGIDVPTAAARAALFDPLEATLVRAASVAGSLTAVWKRLAQTYAQRAMMWATFKSRLMVPGCTLAACAFLAPLPALVSGASNFGGYLWTVARPLGLAAILFWLALRLPGWLVTSGLRERVDRLLLHLPVVGRLIGRSNVRDFLESLALLLEAGVPMFDALPHALETMQNTHLKRAFGDVRVQLMNGAQLSDALMGLPFVDTDRLVGFVLTGETAGKLPEMLFRQAAIETDEINGLVAQLCDWLPRFIWAVIAFWVAQQVIAGHLGRMVSA